MGIISKRFLMTLARRAVKNKAISALLQKKLQLKSARGLKKQTTPMVVILSLGKGGHSYSAARAAKALGYPVLLISPRPVPHEMAYSDFLIQLDPLTQINEIISRLKGLPILGVSISIKHILLPAQAKIADSLGLISVGEKVGVLCNNKFEWRKELQAANILQPKFSDNYKDIEQLEIIQKPKMGTGSKGVMFLAPFSSPPEMHDPQGDLSVGPDLYYEEYLEGEQYDVEGVSFNGEHRVIAIIKEKYQKSEGMFPPKYFLFNPDISDKVNLLLVNETKKILDASGVINGAWHVESRLINGVVYPIDFANRMGYERFMSRASGLDFSKQHVSAFIPNLELDFKLRPKKLLQFFAMTDDEWVKSSLISKQYPENIFDIVAKPFSMGTVRYKGMIVVESSDEKLFWKIVQDLPLDENNQEG